MTETVLLRPAHEKADIPDPEHGFQPLPFVDAGVPRLRTAYWAGHIAQGDVVVVEAAPAEQATQGAPASPES